jgi:hypothetical protein
LVLGQKISLRFYRFFWNEISTCNDLELKNKAIEIMAKAKIELHSIGGVEFCGFFTFLGRTLKLTFQTMQNLKRAF